MSIQIFNPFAMVIKSTRPTYIRVQKILIYQKSKALLKIFILFRAKKVVFKY